MTRRLIKYLGLLSIIIFLLSACSNEEQEDINIDNSNGSDDNTEEQTEENVVESSVQDLYLYMEERDLEQLYSRDPNSDDRLSGYVKLDPDSDEVLELDGGLRFRGNTARGLEKKSFNIRFEEDQDFLFGSNRMNLNGMFRDPSMMREKLAWEMFSEVDHPAPRAKYFNLYVNDIFEGLYVHIERVDSDLLESHQLNPEGTLVRDRMRGFYDGEEFDVYSSFSFDLSTVDDASLFLEGIYDYRGDPQWEELADLLNWVRETPSGTEFANKFEEEMNSDRFIDWLALHFIVGDIDSYGDDYWLYLDHEDPEAKWEIIPWDKNLTFGSHSRAEYGVLNDYFAYEYPLKSSWDNLLFEKILETPELKEKVDDRLVELMDEVISSEFVHEKVDQYHSQIRESVDVRPSSEAFQIHPQNHFGELEDYDQRLEVIETFIDLRYEYIRAQIGLNNQAATYEATKDLTETDQTIFFTGSNGFVMGSFTSNHIEEPASITLSVEENEAVDGVMRTYHVDVPEGSVDGTLTLFYRNDLGWPAGGNWYKNDLAVGDQGNLTLTLVENDSYSPLDSEVNPYTNRVSAEVTLQGSQSFILTLNEQKES